MTADTDGPGLPLRPEEWEALAVKWPRLPETEREHFHAQMTRAQRRRFERTCAQMHDGERSFAGKVTTREDVAQMLALYTERTVFPIVADLVDLRKEVEYLRLPWWRRAKVTLAVWRAVVVKWLALKGVRFVRIEEPEVSDSGGGRGEDAAQGAPVAVAEGTGEPPPTTSSLIEVVPR